MVRLIVGEKGKGKTKHLIDQVNSEVKNASGNIAYIDKSMRHMHDLNNRVRLINIKEYPILNSDSLIGFLCGILSQDNDLEQIYLDSFLTIANLEDQDVSTTIDIINKISEKYKVDFIISISMKENKLPESVRPYISVSL